MLGQPNSLIINYRYKLNRFCPNKTFNKMQCVPPSLLQVGVSYRVHQDRSDLQGTLFRKNIFHDGDVRYIFDHLLVYGSPQRQVPTLMRSVDPVTHTFYVTAQNMWVQRIIAAKTGILVQSPLITQYF